MPAPAVTTVTGQRYLYIAGSTNGADSCFGYICGIGEINSTLLGYARGLFSGSAAKYLFVEGSASGSSYLPGYAGGLASTSSVTVGWTRGIASGSSYRGGYARGGGVTSTSSLNGFLSGSSTTIPTDRLISGVHDLGEAYNTSDWYYDWVTTLYNEASVAVWTRSATTPEAVFAETWVPATREVLPLSTVKRYHQFALDVVAAEPYTFILHQVSVKARKNFGRVSGTVYDSASNAVLSGASVKVGTTTQSTDATGAYSVASVPQGTVTVRGSLTGYRSQSIAVYVAAGVSITQDLYLVPSTARST